MLFSYTIDPEFACLLRWVTPPGILSVGIHFDKISFLPGTHPQIFCSMITVRENANPVGAVRQCEIITLTESSRFRI